MALPKLARLDIRAVVEHYGGDVPFAGHGSVKMRCFLPGHEDSQPSAVMYEDKGYYRCFTCDVALDGYALIMRLESCDFVSAITHGVEKFGGSVSSLSRATSEPRRRTPLRISERGERTQPRDDSPVSTGSRARRKRIA